MLIATGDFMGVSKTSACRLVRKISAAIASLRPQYINMYRDNGEMEKAAEDFYGISSFPRVIRSIDCTLIKIESPGGEDAEIFHSRKGFFALTVQTVSDSNPKIKNLAARNLKREFEDNRYGRYILIGDSGYAIEPFIMTKLQHTRTAAENLYNESIIRTRNVVERKLERRFLVLSLGMRLRLPTVMNIIIAMAILHNIAVDMNDNFPEEWLEDDENVNEVEDNVNNRG
ncbi:hypothetical protein NQ314_021438 [Rhamnusium bicolor]|uniref:DDE Tnp4 domain-containing protein n=1 Tax=Rhamnusium bicolor TaxID=1586634 RepID=A0AAV8WIX8_9CUCU|nr:hypothetical protein NQ314_021438 [Rhamnusium bicolor]